MDRGIVKRSENLCKIFGIPPATVGDHADKAAVILNALYGMPVITDKSQRRNFGNNLLASTRSAFRENSDFVYGIGRNVIMMQEFPYFFENLTLSTKKLVDRYVDLERLVACLAFLGFGATAGAGTAVATGAAKALEENSLRSGIKHAAGSFFGRSEILAILQKKYGNKLRGVAGATGGILIVGGVIVYESATQQMSEIRSILYHNNCDGKMSPDQYKLVFGEDGDIGPTEKYWEM